MPPPLPTHLEKKLIDKAKNELEYGKISNYTTDPTRPGLANGPYKLAVYKPGYYFEYKRNSKFYGKKPPFDRVQIRFFKNFDALSLAFRTKEIDMISNGLTAQRAEDMAKFIADEHLDGQVTSTPTTQLAHLEFNLSHDHIKEVAFRKALAMMIDPNELKLLVGGDGDLTGSLLHPTDSAYSEDDAKLLFSYEKRKAQKLLHDSGYKRTNDGKLQKNDKQVEINLLYNSENADRERVATYLAEKWETLGIQVHVKKQLKRVLYGEILNKGDFDVVVFGWSMPKGYDQPGLLTAQAIPSEENHYTKSNFSRWSNAVAGELYAKVDHESDPKQRKIMLSQFQKIFREDLTWLPLYFRKSYGIVPRSFKNFSIFPDWEPESLEIESWEVAP